MRTRPKVIAVAATHRGGSGRCAVITIECELADVLPMLDGLDLEACEGAGLDNLLAEGREAWKARQEAEAAAFRAAQPQNDNAEPPASSPAAEQATPPASGGDEHGEHDPPK